MYPTVIQAHDDELRRRVISFLVARAGITHWATLQVTVDHSVVVLRGQAGSEQEKQCALQCCRKVAGVVRVVDQLKVSPMAATNGENHAPQRSRVFRINGSQSNQTK